MAPGEAACAWGVPSGPYLVLPLLGPSTLRDATAALAANAALAQGLGAAPVAGWQAGDAFLGYERAEGELARIATQSLDPYAVLRSAWLQRRVASCAADAAAMAAAD
jgi:phospholipid-binding lipoprotein MlaA